MSDALAIVVVGLGTYAIRASFIILLANRGLPPGAQRAVRNVGPAVLAALVASLLVGEQGLAGLAPSVELGALVVAGLVAWRLENVLFGLIAGMLAFWVGLAIF